MHHLGPGQKSMEGKPQSLMTRGACPAAPSGDPSGAVHLNYASGNNSDDEYGSTDFVTEQEWGRRDYKLAQGLRRKGWIIKPMKEDGACLFRAISDQVHGNEDMHLILRSQCMNYLMYNRIKFEPFIDENFEDYIARKRQHKTHGNHVEVQALSDMLNRVVEIYTHRTVALKIVPGSAKPDNEPIRLSYHKNRHYNSVVEHNCIRIDPGLPGITFKVPEVHTREGALRQCGECAVEKEMNPIQEDAIPCPKGCPWCCKMSKISPSSSTSPNWSEIDVYDFEPEPMSSNQNKYGAPGKMSQIASTEQDLCNSMPASMAGSPLWSGSSEANGHDAHASMHSPSGQRFISAATTSHTLGLAGPHHSPNQHLPSSRRNFRFGWRDNSEEAEDGQALVRTAQDIVSPSEPGPSQGRHEMSVDLCRPRYSVVNVVPPEALGLTGWGDDAKISVEDLVTSQEEDSKESSTQGFQ